MGNSLNHLTDVSPSDHVSEFIVVDDNETVFRGYGRSGVGIDHATVWETSNPKGSNGVSLSRASICSFMFRL